jgi:hypothetical protein
VHKTRWVMLRSVDDASIRKRDTFSPSVPTQAELARLRLRRRGLAEGAAAAFPALRAVGITADDGPA